MIRMVSPPRIRDHQKPIVDHAEQNETLFVVAVAVIDEIDRERIR
jgi:hypothetical protein